MSKINDIQKLCMQILLSHARRMHVSEILLLVGLAQRREQKLIYDRTNKYKGDFNILISGSGSENLSGSPEWLSQPIYSRAHISGRQTQG
jgi:hypothetical protein